MISTKSITAIAVLATLASQHAAAQAPPSAEPPSRAQMEERAKKREANRAPPLTLETRDKILTGLYDTLRQTPDKQSAKPIIEAIKQAWSFSGSPTVDLLLDRAAAAIEMKDSPVAMKLIDTAMELQPDFPRSYMMRAMAHITQGDSRRAIDDLRRTISLDPKNFVSYGMLADELLKQKQFKESREALETLLKLCPAAKELYPDSGATSRGLNDQGI
jgi:tetratricopeptide (TPR) repeat protein